RADVCASTPLTAVGFPSRDHLQLDPGSARRERQIHTIQTKVPPVRPRAWVRERKAMNGDTATPPEERYEKTAAFVWTVRAFELLETGNLRAEIQEHRPGVRSSHVWGQCPRCEHRIDDWQPLSAVTGLIGRRRSGLADRDADVELVDVSCGCGTTHPGAPPGTTGCGVSFRVEFERLPDGSAGGQIP